MDNEGRSLRMGAAVVVCALLMRLLGGGLAGRVAQFLAQPKISSFLIYLETGRIVRFSPSLEEDAPAFAPESPKPDFFLPARPQEKPVFTAADADLKIKYNCSLRPDLSVLIAQPLNWDLTADGPTVLIVHTHATESYTREPEEDYKESSAYRTLDERYNMISVGAEVARLLEEGGVGVIHDRVLHDYPSYNGSYNHARKSIESYLKQYPTIRLVLDIHRDASGDNKNQLHTEATVGGEKSAQIMLVVGTNASGLKHPNWEQNLALGLKLHVQLERLAPGICRYVNLRAQRFNQDESPGALIVEVGGAGNSHDEALRAAGMLAQAILALACGTVTSDSTS